MYIGSGLSSELIVLGCFLLSSYLIELILFLQVYFRLMMVILLCTRLKLTSLNGFTFCGVKME